MNYTKNHRMAGHFNRDYTKEGKFNEDEKSLVIRVVGFDRSKLTQRDVNYICSFYHVPWTESWLVEGDDNYNYKVIIKKEAANHEEQE